MRNKPVFELELVLSLFVTRDRAASILGDLLETADENGMAWFWMSFLRILISLAWRPVLAWAGAYATGITMLSIALHLGPFWQKVEPIRYAHQQDALDLTLLATAALMSAPLWFLAPYCILRYGLRDRVTLLTITIGALSTLAFVFGPLQWIMRVCTACAIALSLVALARPAWRRPFLVSALTSAAGVLIAMAASGSLVSITAHSFHWSPSALGALTRLDSVCAFMLFLAAFSYIRNRVLYRLDAGRSIAASAR